MSNMATAPIRLFDVPWEQVLCKHFLPFFLLKEVFQLRGVCSEFRDLVDCYFSLNFTVNTTSCSFDFSRNGFRVLTSRNFHLKELILCNARDWLSDGVLIAVLQNNPSLHTVDLSHCLNISDASVYALGANCHQVKHLSLRGCVWLSRQGLLSLMTNRLQLEHVDLSGCWDLSDDDIINLTADCSNIRYLMLNNIYGLTDRCISQLAHRCPRLLQLSIQACWRITDQAIQMVGEFCPDLRALQVRECPKVTEFSLAKLRAKKVRIDKAPPPVMAVPWRGPQPRPLNLQI
ncbi:F-box/LRR-repeat protein 15-like [Littorina saxatilis]|uniref:F-box/LRR-repeat protein 15-like leucin rich repeat domain-containing protein n=1 Tax=Littorina saxatilis TaxID=31220 RepID=A0AAN9BXH5_9CAEN